MKKTIKLQDSPKSKMDKSMNNEIEKRIIFKRKNCQKEEYRKNLTTKANTTITDSSKDEKKENTNSKKNSKEEHKLKKLKEKDQNKTIDITSNLTQKKTKNKIKKIKANSNSKKRIVKSSLSHKNFEKLKGSNSNKFNLTKNITSNNSCLSSNRADSTNNILLGSDNFIKSLLTKYMDGTENIINEDLEPFNNITNNDDYENFSFLDENINENNLIKGPLITDTNILPKEDIKKEDIKINKNNNKNNKNKPSSLHIKKKLPKLYINNDKKDDNQIKTNFYNSFICSPSRMSEGKFFMNSQTKLTTLNQKINDNLPKKRKSLTKKKKKEKNNDKSDDSKESKLKRKIIYSKKIIDSLNKFKNNKNNDLELKNKENFPISASNLNLDIIFENKNLLNAGTHHYLINTVSTKNKMVQKKINSFEQNKNALNTFNKVSTICLDNDTYDTNINLCRRTIFRLNRTPKIKKNFKAKERFSFNNTINNNSTRNNLRKYSFRLNRELSLENNLSGMSTMINSKIFNGKLDDYLITKELGKGSYAVVKLATHKITKNKYAIKIYSKQSLIDPQKRNTVKNEINILKQIDNENIMKLYEVIDTPSNLYLVLEYINGINLLEIIKNEKFHFIKEQRAKKIFLQVVKGISYCHKKNIFHRDIKLENILVLKDDTIKIIDFGFGIKCNKDMYQKLFCGTPSYMPPEIVKKEKYIACYSDIWSLGVLFYAMLYGIFPFKGKDDDDLFEKINEAQIIFPEYNLISDKIKELFGKIFVVNPTQRVSLDDMINILEE